MKIYMKSVGQNCLMIALFLAAILLLPHIANAKYGGSMESVMNSAISASKSFIIAENSVYESRANAARAGGQSSTGRTGGTPPQPARQYPIAATDFKTAPGYLLPDQLASSAQNL